MSIGQKSVVGPIGRSWRWIACLAVLAAFCGAAPTQSGASGTSVLNTALTDPEGIAFWSASRGLLIAHVTTPGEQSGYKACAGNVIESTLDGGRSWNVVDRVAAPLNAVAVTGSQVGWVTSGGDCQNPDASGSRHLLLTTDGGRSWRRVESSVAVASPSPVSAAVAWAERGAWNPIHTTASRLIVTHDGGRSWRQARNPCAGVYGLALWSLDFASPTSGWAMCTSEPATIQQPKALFATVNGGATWQLRSSTCTFTANGTFPPPVGVMACAGYGPGISLLANGYGWQWTDRYGLAATSDGGATWAPIATSVVTDDINQVLSASVLSDTTGFLLISAPETNAACPAQGCGPQLLSTTNSGDTWTTAFSWSPPAEG
jgi:photosystem II stability/assembly factor-like uncharacterized protein